MSVKQGTNTEYNLILEDKLYWAGGNKKKKVTRKGKLRLLIQLSLRNIICLHNKTRYHNQKINYSDILRDKPRQRNYCMCDKQIWRDIVTRNKAGVD